MGRTKDLYTDQCERRAAEFEARGFTPGAAWDMAADRAWEDLADHYADMADHARDLAQERGR